MTASSAFDALAIVDVLDRHWVEYVAVGGWAAIQYGAGRPTEDLDICPRWTAENLERVAGALRELGGELVVSPGETVPVPAVDGVLISRMEIGNWRTPVGGLDILKQIPYTSRQDTVGFDELSVQSTPIEIDGRRIRVASLDALIHSKQVADRPKDRESLPELRRLRDLHRKG